MAALGERLRQRARHGDLPEHPTLRPSVHAAEGDQVEPLERQQLPDRSEVPLERGLIVEREEELGESLGTPTEQNGQERVRVAPGLTVRAGVVSGILPRRTAPRHQNRRWCGNRGIEPRSACFRRIACSRCRLRRCEASSPHRRCGGPECRARRDEWRMPEQRHPETEEPPCVEATRGSQWLRRASIP